MCGGARRYGRFGGSVMADRTIWKVEIRYHEDDNVERTVCADGRSRDVALKIAEGIEANLDHDRFYTELVELD